MKTEEALKTIKDLRECGFTVYVNHHRYEEYNINWSIGDPGRVSPRGGSTRVEIKSEDGTLLCFGESHCSTIDNFNRKLGRNIALGRALKDCGAILSGVVLPEYLGL